MAKRQKSKKKNLPAYLYRVSNSGPNRLHIEIPSKDRPEFQSGKPVIVIPYEDHIKKQLKETIGPEFEIKTSEPHQKRRVRSKKIIGDKTK